MHLERGRLTGPALWRREYFTATRCRNAEIRGVAGKKIQLAGRCFTLMPCRPGRRNALPGRAPGCISPEQITVFDSSGIAMQDLTIARRLVATRG